MTKYEKLCLIVFIASMVGMWPAYELANESSIGILIVGGIVSGSLFIFTKKRRLP